MIPFKVLATYRPKRWKAWKVGRDLTALTARLGYKPHYDPVHGAQDWCPWVSESLHAEVKRRTTRSRQGEDWHYDGDTTPGSKPDCLIVLWSSNFPTQFRDEAGQIYQPKPYEVVLFHNRKCVHRRPPNVPKVRWTFRQRLALDKGVKV